MPTVSPATPNLAERHEPPKKTWGTFCFPRGWRRFATRVALLLLMPALAVPTIFSGVAAAQPPVADESGSISVSDGTYDAYGENINGVAPIGGRGAYLLFEKQINSGVGYQDGYSTIGGFVPYEFADLSVIFGTARVFVTDDDELPGVNVGVGYRHYMPEVDQFIGVNAFFDSDQTPSEFRYDQVTFGAEWVGDVFEARSNVYLPTSDVSNQTGVLFTGVTPFFDGNQILFEDTGLFETPMKGVDFEVGTTLFGYSWARGYVGTYYYNAPTEEDDPVGFRGRLFFNFTNDIATQVQVTEDSLFGTRITVGVQITFSGRPMFTPFPRRTVLDKRYDQVFRNYRIAMGASQAPVNTPAINPGTLLPYIVTHVDDSNVAPGTGTFEDPFTTLQSANSDIILVWRGNTTPATPLIGGVSLINNQRLLGEGVPHTFDVLDRGTFAFSDLGFDDAGDRPYVTQGAVGPVIELANNNEVSGFNIIDTTVGRSAILGNGIVDFNINNVDVVGDGHAFNLTNASGIGRIVDSSFDIGLGVNSNGVSIVNTATAPLDLTIDNFATASGGLNALRIVANASDVDATVTDFMADANRTGLNLAAAAGGELNVDVSDSTFTNATGVLVTEGRAVLVNNVTGTVDLAMTNVDGSNASSNGLEVNTSAGGLFTGTIANGSFSDAGGNGILLDFNNTDENNSLVMTNTTVDNATFDGLNALVQNNSLLTIDITDGSFLNAGQDAFDTTVTVDSTLNLTVDPTPATGAGSIGFLFNVSNNSELNASFLDSDLGMGSDFAIWGSVLSDSLANVSFVNGSLANNVVSAISATVNDSELNLVVDNADAQNNGSNGAQFFVTNGGELTAAISNSDFSNNTGDAFLTTVSGNSTAIVDLDTVLADNSGDSGFDFTVLNQSQFDLTATNSSFVTSASHGITGTVDNSVANVAFSQTTIDNSMLNGVDLRGTNGSTINADFETTTIFSNTLNGLQIALEDSDAIVNFEDVFVNSNGADGFSFSAISGSTMDVTGDFALFSLNSLTGIFGFADGPGSIVTMNVNELVAVANGLDGIVIGTSNGGVYEANFTESLVTDNGGDGVRLVATTNGSTTISFNDSDVSRNTNTGIWTLATVNSSTSIDLMNTTVSFNDIDGLFLQADDSTADVTFGGNTQLDDNGSDGFDFVVVNGATMTVTAPGDFVARSFSDNFHSGIAGVIADPGTSVSIDLNQTDIDTNFLFGMEYQVSGGATLDVALQDVTIVNHFFGNGINTSVTGAGSTAIFDILTSNISDNGDVFSDSGFVLDVSAGADAVADFRFTELRNNVSRGALINVDGLGSTLELLFDGNTQVTNNEDTGVELNLSNFALVTTAEFAGQFTTNLGDGVEINASSNSRIDNLLLTESASLSSNFGNGLDLNMDSSDVTTLGITSANNRNQASGISISALNSSTIGDLSFFGTADENVLNDGMNITLDDSAITNASISGSLSSNGDRGLDIDLLGTSTVNDFQVAGAFVTGNQSDGIDINVIDAAFINPMIGNSFIANNGDSGFELTVNQIAPATPITVTVNNSNQFIGNDDGVFLRGLSDAEIVAFIDTNSFTNNSGAGVRVLTEDDSSFGLAGNASTITDNDFTGNDDGVFLNAEDQSNHDVDIFSIINLQTFTGNDFGVRILTDSVGGPSLRDYDLDGLFIVGSGEDGVSIDLNGQLDDVTNINIGLVDTVESSSNTSDGFALRTTGGTNNIVIDDSIADTNIQDGFRYLHEGGNTTYVLENSSGINNGGRGASVDVRAAGSSSLVDNNKLSNNGAQGLLLATLTNTYPSDPIFIDADPDAPQDFINNQSTDVFTTLMIAQSNNIANNNDNGLVLSVGSSTRMNAVVNDNTFSGNTFIDPVDDENNTYDIRIFPVRSVNPTNSINVDSPGLDTVYRDPVAHLDLVFGASGNPVNAKFGNRGEQIDVLTEGTSISATITQSGRFTNSDPLKATYSDPVTGEDNNNRPVRGYFQVHGHDANPVLDLLDGTNVDGGNFFILDGTVQSMFNTFSGANFLFPPLGTPFPDPGYP